MKILIACEYSGIVRDAFTKKGHDAWSCDILPTEIEGQHIQGDVTDILLDSWDMIIAFPPCTYLSNAGACRLYPKKGQIDENRYQKGLEGKKFFMQFYNHNCNKIVIENPVSSKVFNMPKFSQEIQPYEYGHPFSKKTRLWVKGLPNLKPTNIVEKKHTFIESGTSKYKDTNKNKNRNIPRYGKERSRFWSGIAAAMADQWSNK